MQVFKFGGSAIFIADGIRRLAEIVEANPECRVVVVSALGKTTNALEKLFSYYFEGNNGWLERFNQIKQFHRNNYPSNGLESGYDPSLCKKGSSNPDNHPSTRFFMIEQSFGQIFSTFNKFKIKINLVQTSAISLSICADSNRLKIDLLLNALKKDFRITFNKGVQLITIRHYTDGAIRLMTAEKQILIEQKSRHTVHFVLKDAK